MGNSLGGRSIKKTSAKIMKINGQMFRMKIPVQAGEVVKNYPGYVLLEFEAVKHYGIRAKPLEAQQELEPKRLYFLVELPHNDTKVVLDDDDDDKDKLLPGGVFPRRVRSGIHMSAKERLESLKLARRSTSDLSLMKQNTTASSTVMLEDDDASSFFKNNNNNDNGGGGSASAAVRLKLRLPKAEVAKLLQESKDEAEATQKIMDLCMAKNNNTIRTKDAAGQQQQEVVRLKSGNEIRASEGYKKRVSFMPVNQGDIQLPMGGAPGIESW